MNHRFKPRLDIEIGGHNERELVKNIQRIEVDESIDNPSMFSFEVSDTENMWLKKGTLDPETSDVKIYMGYEGENRGRALITGRIMALSHSFSMDQPSVLTVQGFDHSSLLQKTFNNRESGFKNQTCSEIVSILAKNVGLSCVCDLMEGIYSSKTANLDESDYTFLKRMAKERGCDCYVRDKILYFQKHKRPHPVGILSWARSGGNNLRGIKSINMRLSNAKVVPEIIVRGFNPKENRALVCKQYPKYAVNSNPPPNSRVLEQNMILNTQEEVDNRAQFLADDASKNIEIDAVLVGDSTIRAGTYLTVRDICERFCGAYYITTANHSIDFQDGYSLKLSMIGPVAV